MFYRIFKYIAYGVAVTLAASLNATDEGNIHRQAHSFVERDGIPNFARKLNAGEPVVVAFLGGSITVNRSGFTGQVPHWLRQTYSGVEVNVINAGISGTPSRFGAQRLDRDVLTHDPDLIFVEFAVNDGNNDASEAMERIVRKTWTNNPETDLVFIYTLNLNSQLADYAQGTLPQAAASHEKVAQYYNIPTIGMAFDAAEQINTGQMDARVFAPDLIHPKKDGYAIYLASITRALTQMLDVNKTAPPKPHSLPDPLTKNLILYPQISPVTLPEVAPLKTTDGRASVETYPVPVAGRHWTDECVFSNEGQPLWEMKSIAYKTQQQPNSTIGIAPKQWEDACWFADGGYFTGATGTRLWGLDKAKTPVFSTSTRALPVLIFIAPTDGDYYFEATSETMNYFGPPTKTACFNVVRLRWGEAEGTSIASQVMVKKDEPSLKLSGGTWLRAGEQLAFIIGKDSLSRVNLPNFNLVIGRMP
ncbi:SGNH/GDSL hydrolase family protein [Coraliomargarita sp. W4R72]